MAEYIDRKEALTALVEEGQASRRYRLGETWELNYDEISAALNRVPVANDLNTRAQWELDSDNLPCCSNCGEAALQRLYFDVNKRVLDCRLVQSKFCPNCGKRMNRRT